MQEQPSAVLPPIFIASIVIPCGLAAAWFLRTQLGSTLGVSALAGCFVLTLLYVRMTVPLSMPTDKETRE